MLALPIRCPAGIALVATHTTGDNVDGTPTKTMQPGESSKLLIEILEIRTAFFHRDAWKAAEFPMCAGPRTMGHLGVDVRGFGGDVSDATPLQCFLCGFPDRAILGR